MAGILLLAEQRFGSINETTLELITAAKKFAELKPGKISLAILGEKIGDFAKTLSKLPVDEVIKVENPLLKDYTPDGYAKVMVELVKKTDTETILIAHTYQGMDLSAKIATKLNIGLASNCSNFELKDDTILWTRPAYNTKLKQKIFLKDKTLMATIERGAFPQAKQAENQAAITEHKTDLKESDIRTKVKEVISVMKGSTDISKEKILVAAGRGIGKPENIHLLKELAKALGGDLAASRPVVDAGWTERERQVGQSGKNVSPDLYLACGISGAMQHVSGMKKSKCIVAINKDPDAPIFSLAHYGIVGDLMEVVPALIEEAKKIR